MLQVFLSKFFNFGPIEVNVFDEKNAIIILCKVCIHFSDQVERENKNKIMEGSPGKYISKLYYL